MHYNPSQVTLILWTTHHSLGAITSEVRGTWNMLTFCFYKRFQCAIEATGFSPHKCSQKFLCQVLFYHSFHSWKLRRELEESYGSVLNKIVNNIHIHSKNFGHTQLQFTWTFTEIKFFYQLVLILPDLEIYDKWQPKVLVRTRDIQVVK